MFMRSSSSKSKTRLPEVFATAAAALVAGHATAATEWVTQAGDSGPGTFRAAVEAANADASIDRIRFKPWLTVELDTAVVYTGDQNLEIRGARSEVTASGASTPADTWDAGLFASRSAANLTLRKIAFTQSFNNGVGVFIPEDATGTVSVKLIDVDIEEARFHGLYIDNQASTGYNTDDVIHPDCEDPHFVDAEAGVSLVVRESQIVGNGTLAGGYNTGEPFEVEGETFLTGCPADFDGIRVDDGGAGSIEAHVTRSHIDDNLADGIEYDERGDGAVWSFLGSSSVARNGETGTDDLDDGHDIDEDDAGDLIALFWNVQVVDNRDEGLDLDEAGEGSAYVTVVNSEASRNEDQGVKVDESDAGNLFAIIKFSTVNDSLSQNGTEFTEEDGGHLDVAIIGTEITGNDDAAVAGEQELPGTGDLVVRGGNLAGNGDPSFDLTDIDLDVAGAITD